MAHLITLLAVALGGAAGSLGRYLLSAWCNRWLGNSFPYGTLMVNVLGCFIMGMVMALLLQQSLSAPWWRPLIAVGFLGGLTTFSAFSMETLLLFTQGEWPRALLNIVLNLLLSLLAVTLGYLLLHRSP
ncbi:MAG: fluoride efflux transporter CrcB [Enterobacteriaceae bacterium]